MKKILSLVLCMLLVLSAATVGIAEEKPTSWLCDEKTTLTVCTYDAVSQAFPTIGNDLRFWQWLEEYTNVHIEWEVHSNADYDTVKAAKLAAGELDADIINLGAGMANEAGMAGQVIDMTPYLETCAPNTLAWNENENPNVIPSSKAPDGNQYYLGGSVSPDMGHIVLHYNTAWMEKLGLEPANTLEEFEAILYAMKEAGDLNGNGEDDEIILTSTSIGSLANVLNTVWGLEGYEDVTNFAAKDGEVYSEHVSENMKEMFKWMQKMFADGIIDKGIATNSADIMSQKIANEQVGIFIYYSAFCITYGSLMPAGQADPLGEHYTMGKPLANKETGEQYLMLRNRPTNDCTAVTANCKNPELAIKWLDTLISDPEVMKVRCNGWEGEQYYYDEDGTKKLIYEEDGTWSISKFGCGQLAMPHYQTYDQLMNSKLNVPWYVEQYNALLEPVYMFKAPTVPPTNSFTLEEKEMLDYVESDVKTYFNEQRAKFITDTTVDIDAEWQAYTDMMYSLGLQDMVDAYQSYYDRVLAG